MTVRVVAFARIREILGVAQVERRLAAGTTAGSVWEALAAEYPALDGLRASTRFARNGALVSSAAALHDGDELALLPPFGGG